MKKRISCLALLLIGCVAFVSLACYQGYIPVASGPDRARLRHALNLKVLPSSIKVNASGLGNWTDYVFEAELSVKPDDFDRLLSGRQFRPVHELPFDGRGIWSYRIADYSPVDVDAYWHCEHVPPNLREGDQGDHCEVYANKARDRVFIRFTAD